MIAINAPIQQEKIIKLLDGYDKDGFVYKFIEKDGIKLIFDTPLEDKNEAAKKAKEIIKAQSWGAILYFQSNAID